MSVPVVLVAGLHGHARAALVARLRAENPGAQIVRNTAEISRDAPLVIVELRAAAEPRPAAEAIARMDGLRLTAVLTALDPELTPVDICCGSDMLPEVLAHQLEYATALVLPPATDDDVDLCCDVLSHLAPYTPVIRRDDPLPALTGRALCVHELAARVDPATAQLPWDADTAAATTVAWRNSEAPLHPGRFFAAMGALAEHSVRSRGRFWLANRPDRMFGWDSIAGTVTIADAGPWLAALACWDLIPPARRMAAELDWTDPYGDRVHHLVFTGPDLDPRAIKATLDACLATPYDRIDEDPFAALLGDHELSSDSI